MLFSMHAGPYALVSCTMHALCAHSVRTLCKPHPGGADSSTGQQVKSKYMCSARSEAAQPASTECASRAGQPMLAHRRHS